ncbi:MAG TPA: hypothetical protein VF306_13040 [Pirellulales bacterium]
MKHYFESLAFAWAAPASLLGLVVGAAALATGGRGRRIGRILEFHGGAARWLLERFPGEPWAMTLGHIVLGRTAAALDMSRNHELLHVRQYERWGPAFLPAYLLASLGLWLVGRDPYRDNPFEVEAYRDAP